MMLRELQAFEACWLDLKDTYPTSQQDNTLIAHAMGRLVDSLGKPTEVEKELPDHLQILFRRLALAYFQGYFPLKKPAVVRAATVATTPQPWLTAEAAKCPEILAAVDQVKELAQKAQMRLRQARCPGRACSTHEMETLIIEFPEHWQIDAQTEY